MRPRKSQRAVRQAASLCPGVRERSRTTVNPNRRDSAATSDAASVAWLPVPWSKVATAAMRPGAHRAIACSSTMESRPPDTASTSGPTTGARATSSDACSSASGGKFVSSDMPD